MQYSAKDKAALRKEFSAVRKAAKSEDKDCKIAERVLLDDHVKNADTVLIYASFGSEADTWLIAEKLLQSGIKTAFPLCHEHGVMTFHVADSIGSIRNGKEGSFGIHEPDPLLPQPVITERTVCIVPGLAFTPSGGRLGYGGGFYDRFIAEHSGIYTIALAYEACITDSLPLLQHDIKVKAIASEERMVFCNDR